MARLFLRKARPFQSGTSDLVLCVILKVVFKSGNENNLQSFYYANMSMQYTAILKAAKIIIFGLIFSIFLL